MEQRVKFDVSFSAVFKVIAALLFVYLIYLIRDVIALLFITVIIVAAISPSIDYLTKWLNRTLAASIIFVIFLLLCSGIVYAIVPPLVEQSTQFARNIPIYIHNLTPYYRSAQNYLPSLQDSFDKISSSLTAASSNIFAATTGVFGGIVSFIMVIVISFYLLLDEQGLKKAFFSVIPLDKKEDVVEISKKIASKVGDWLRGQLLLGLVVGLVDLIGLFIIGVPYALTLALISGLLEFIPVVGPLIAGIIAAIIGLTVSPLTALFVIILYVVVQQLENHILVPQIMKKAVGLSPVVIIIAIFVGAKLMGATGALLAIPVAAVISVIALDWNTVKRIFATNR